MCQSEEVDVGGGGVGVRRWVWEGGCGWGEGGVGVGRWMWAWGGRCGCDVMGTPTSPHPPPQ